MTRALVALLLAGCATVSTAGRESECRVGGGHWTTYYTTTGYVTGHACIKAPLRAGKDAV